jgi:hypothetical protein
MATTASSGPDTRTGPRGRGVLLKLLVVLAVLVLLFAGYCYLVLHWSYSSGEQAGWVQKLSYKGWLCKTWEGEMAMVTMPGTTPEKFHFTIWDEKVAADVNRLTGHRVALHYEEKVGIPSNCFGDTRFYVTGVHPVEEMLIAPSGTIPVVPGGSASGATSPAAPGGQSFPGAGGQSRPGPGGQSLPGPGGAVPMAPGGAAPAAPVGAGPGGAGADAPGGQGSSGGSRP